MEYCPRLCIFNLFLFRFGVDNYYPGHQNEENKVKTSRRHHHSNPLQPRNVYVWRYKDGESMKHLSGMETAPDNEECGIL